MTSGLLMDPPKCNNNGFDDAVLFTKVTRVSDDENDPEHGARKRRASPLDEFNQEDSNKRRASIKGAQHWSQDDHHAFVESVYEIGIKHASPSVILENMNNRGPADSQNHINTMITSERVKSHLQKYRKNNRSKAKDDFMNPYDAWMQKALHLQSSKNKNQFASPEALLEMISSKAMSPGEMAAFLTYSVMMEEEKNGSSSSNDSSSSCNPKTNTVADLDSAPDAKSTEDYLSYLSAGVPLAFPELTAAEKHSSIGSSLLYVHDLFSLMGVQIEDSRNDGTGGSDAADDALSAVALPIMQHHRQDIHRCHEPQRLKSNQRAESAPLIEPYFGFVASQPTIPPYPQQKHADAPLRMSFFDHADCSSKHHPRAIPPPAAACPSSYNNHHHYHHCMHPRCPPPGAPTEHYRPPPPSDSLVYHQQQHEQQHHNHHHRNVEDNLGVN